MTLAFHPSELRDAAGAMTAMLQHLLIRAAPGPMAWLDLSGTLVLRVDDPGSSHSVYKRDWYYPKLSRAEWREIGRELEQRAARLTIGYVPGWVDDGDAVRGTLEVNGARVARELGRIYPSSTVRYVDHEGHRPGTIHDYVSEYQGIQELRAAGVAEVELHGRTHIHPDHAAWASAPDRDYARPWYRELGPGAARALERLPAAEHPVIQGRDMLRQQFGTSPSTLICPGEEWTTEVLEVAHAAGFSLIGSQHLAIRDGARFCWSLHAAGPYLNEPGSGWFEAQLPVVAMFHDRELVEEGIGWMSRWLDEWIAAGARRLIDYRELASWLCRSLRLDVRGGEAIVIVDGGDVPLVRSMEVRTHFPDGAKPGSILVQHGGETSEARLDGDVVQVLGTEVWSR